MVFKLDGLGICFLQASLPCHSAHPHSQQEALPGPALPLSPIQLHLALCCYHVTFYLFTGLFCHQLETPQEREVSLSPRPCSGPNSCLGNWTDPRRSQSLSLSLLHYDVATQTCVHMWTWAHMHRTHSECSLEEIFQPLKAYSCIFLKHQGLTQLPSLNSEQTKTQRGKVTCTRWHW